MKLQLALCLALTGLTWAFPNEDAFIAEINAKAKGQWVAGKNRLTVDQATPLLGALDDHDRVRNYRPESKVKFTAPDEFDSRTNWPDCKSISIVWDQASCGSCWAMAAANAMSDRVCIAKGTQTLVSPYALLTCCGFTCGRGCNGGYPFSAWSYWKRHGLVSGGLYDDMETCQPYQIHPCSHHVDGRYPPCDNPIHTPSCKLIYWSMCS